MSSPVPRDALAHEVERYGAVAFVITVSADGAPHSVSARVRLDGHELVADVGNTTAANIERSARATILWPPRAHDPSYSLIVDGTATIERGDAGATAHLSPTRAVEHRQADAGASLPTCRVVDES